MTDSMESEVLTLSDRRMMMARAQQPHHRVHTLEEGSLLSDLSRIGAFETAREGLSNSVISNHITRRVATLQACLWRTVSCRAI